jgi:hypothetical protein
MKPGGIMGFPIFSKFPKFWSSWGYCGINKLEVWPELLWWLNNSTNRNQIGSEEHVQTLHVLIFAFFLTPAKYEHRSKSKKEKRK